MNEKLGPFLLAVAAIVYVSCFCQGCTHKQDLIEHLEWTQQKISNSQFVIDGTEGRCRDWCRRNLIEAQFEIKSLIAELKR